MTLSEGAHVHTPYITIIITYHRHRRKDGREHGLGLFTFADGSTFRGFWRDGAKQFGVLRPPPGGSGGGGGGGDGSGRGGDGASAVTQAKGAYAGATAGAEARESSGDAPPAAAGGGGDGAAPAVARPRHATAGLPPGAALVREYEDGAIVRQVLLPAADVAAIFGPGPPQTPWRAGAGAGAGLDVLLRGGAKRAAARLGCAVHKGNSVADLVTALQAGLRWSAFAGGGGLGGADAGTVSAMKAAALAKGGTGGGGGGGGELDPLPPAAFAEKVVAAFPRAGSASTPLHCASGDFRCGRPAPVPLSSLPCTPLCRRVRPSSALAPHSAASLPRALHTSHPIQRWTEYAPRAFARVRAHFGWDAAALVRELCADGALRPLRGAPAGKSGAAFLRSARGALLVKTVRKSEARALLARLLPRYEAHVRSQPGSLLARVLGLFSVEGASAGGGKVRFVIVGDVLGSAASAAAAAAASAAAAGVVAEAVAAAAPPRPLRLTARYDLKGSTRGRTAGPAAVAAVRRLFACLRACVM